MKHNWDVNLSTNVNRLRYASFFQKDFGSNLVDLILGMNQYEAAASCSQAGFLTTWGIGRTQPAVGAFLYFD